MFRFAFIVLSTALITRAIALDYHSDSLAVRAILDANKLNTISVAAVTQNMLPHPDSSRVYELHLDSLGIDTIPDQIENLSYLAFLSASGNKLRVLPNTISHFTYLSYLDVSNNKIVSVPDSVFSICYISVRNNLLTKIPDLWFSEPTCGLDFSNNLITSVPQIMWLTVPSGYRRIVNFSGNVLETLPDVPDVPGFSITMQFNFSNNALTTLPASIVNLHHEVCICPFTPLSLDQGIECETYMLKCTYAIDSFINFSGNKLCNLSTDIMAWLDTSAVNWRSSQICAIPLRASPLQEKNMNSQIRCIASASGFSVRYFGQSKSLFAEIFDSRGRLIMSRKVEGNGFEVSKFKPGIYVLSVEENGRILLKRTFFSAR